MRFFLYISKKSPSAESSERDFFIYNFMKGDRKLFSLFKNKSHSCSCGNNSHCCGNSDKVLRTGVGVLFGGRTAVAAGTCVSVSVSGTGVVVNVNFASGKNVSAKSGTAFADDFNFNFIVKIYFAVIDNKFGILAVNVEMEGDFFAFAERGCGKLLRAAGF